MPTLIREKTVKARKPHACMLCNVVCIKPGQTYLRQTYAYDGQIYDWVMCTDCTAISDFVWEWAYYTDEGIGSDTYQEWALDTLAWSDNDEEREAAQAFIDRYLGEGSHDSD